jgi:hypothetical protein
VIAYGIVKQGGVGDKGTLVLFALKARANTRRWLSRALSVTQVLARMEMVIYSEQ